MKERFQTCDNINNNVKMKGNKKNQILYCTGPTINVALPPFPFAAAILLKGEKDGRKEVGLVSSLSSWHLRVRVKSTRDAKIIIIIKQKEERRRRRLTSWNGMEWSSTVSNDNNNNEEEEAANSSTSKTKRRR